jgi:hypothetical protein
MSVFTESGIGLEGIQREVVVVLAEGLNDEIDRIEETWNERDAEYAAQLGKQPSETVIEHISVEHMHEGHRPSLIMSTTPPDEYPNLSVMAYSSTPLNNPIDQGTSANINIDIEVMVKAQEHDELESQAVADRRLHRTIEAIHNTLTRNSDLNGKILGFNNDPTVNLTNIFVRHGEVEAAFEDFWWQLGTMRYIVARNADLPMDIDQI